MDRLKLILFLLIYVVSVSTSATDSPTEVATRYTLLANSSYELKPGLNCELVVMVDFDQSELKLIRVNAGKTDHNVNHLRNYPNNYHSYGKIYKLDDMFPEIQLEDLKKVESLFKVDLKRKKYNLLITAHMKDKSKLEHLEAVEDYYSDKPQSCLR